ncbi:AGAP000703-PA-like protein [Anopheles sinensis]|uniref:AGAP000703-PA-like protein n=1 Tax=Anopheles sinensis TaxID=74873 RepID=A0A084VGP3_ANOSI|nr:AGAP000703-PA-like protein [Anopheles sinensis]
MVGGGEMKVATVDVESSDNMATLPVSRAHGVGGAGGAGSSDTAEKNNAANKEMELKNVMPKPLQRTSLFIVTSLVYAMLLIVVCVAYVISDVTTHRLPVIYYEGFFTYLYGASILFLLYVFCFLLQESSCCNGKPKPPKEKKPKKEKKSKKATDAEAGKDGKDERGKYVLHIISLRQESTPDPEAALSPRFKRKTTQDPAHGSFFLRVGAIAFGLGTMIYTGLEFGSFFEIPFTSPCHQILRGVNPLLQMIFTFMQMYFIFMNARLNIHRFKVLARFGLMHIVATNICVWIRTLVLESLKEITAYHQRRGPEPEDSAILENIRQHTLRNAGMVMGTELGPGSDVEWEPISVNLNAQEDLLSQDASSVLSKIVQGTVHTLAEATTTLVTAASTPSTTTTTSTAAPTTTTSSTTTSTTTTTPLWTEQSTSTTGSTATSTTTTTARSFGGGFLDRLRDIVTTEVTTASTSYESPSEHFSTTDGVSVAGATNATTASIANPSYLDSLADHVNYLHRNSSLDQTYESLDALFPSAFIATSTAVSSNSTAVSCGRVNIMGTIVQDSAPYLYPFIIEYSLIGAAVIYVMWKHIGRYPK